MRSKLMLLIFVPLLLGFTNPESVYGINKQYADSIINTLKTKSGQEKLESYLQIITSLRNIDPAQGINIAQIAITLADQLKNPRLKAEIINEEAVCYRKLHIYEKSLALHYEALKLFEKLSDSMGIAFTFANIGNVYNAYNDTENALDYHFKALKIKEHLKDESQIAYSFNAIGMVLIQKRQYTQALEYFNKAIDLRKKHNEMMELANIYGNIGSVMVELNRLDEALDYLKLSENVYIKSKSGFGLAMIYNKMAEIYLKKNMTDSTSIILKRAEKLALKQSNLGLLSINYSLQSKYFEKTNQFEQALNYNNKAWSAQDSLMNERKIYELNEIRVRYETDKLDSDNEILRLKVKEQDLKLKVYITILISLTFIVFAAFAIWRYLKNKKMSKHLALVNQSLENRVNERTKELTEQIQAREQTLISLKQSEEKFKTISETSPFGIAVTNDTGKIVILNKKLLECSAITELQFLDGSWFNNIIVEDRDEVIVFWNALHKTAQKVDEISFRMIINDAINWFYLKVAPMFNDDRYIGFVAVLDNITRQKEFENELIRSKNKAEESDKLKSAFLANMSHEIRTPMNAILGFSDLLSSEEYDETEKIEFINMIKSSGRLLLNLINDIIDISKIEAGELKIQTSSFPIVTMLDETYNTFKQQLEQNGRKNVQLIFNHREAVAHTMITTDRLRLQQILTNLLSNALKFTHVGEIEFGVIHIDGHFEFYVRDSGIGIPESKLEVVFERFRQADDSHTRLYGGTGLGLAITKNLTHLLGGKIWVESVEGRGTIFYFTLPAEDENDDSKGKTHKIKQNVYPNYSGKTVLVAEDVETNHQLVGAMLKRLNFNILYATNGLIALDIASKANVDLILMDIQMPEMDGVESMKKIKKLGLTMPIIAITAFSLIDQDQEYLDMGFDGFISKPFNLVSLISTFRHFFKQDKN